VDQTAASERVLRLFSDSRVLLAPMAGVTEAPFRAICKRMGAGLTYTEMVSVKALHYNPDSDASRALLTISPDETPCAVQIFGSEPEMMAAQAARIVESFGDSIALIDINMGCPVTKVVAKGEGSALMRDPRRASLIVTAVASACSVPVTAKFRKGWDEDEVNAVEFAVAMQGAGAAAVAVHGRTRGQFYKGRADWDTIAAVKAAVQIPVIGSGDVFCADDVAAMLDRTGVDAVMVARGAQGNPWIFREALGLLGGDRLDRPDAAERIEMAREHSRALAAFAGARSFVRMRKHVAWYIADMPGASYVRGRVNTCKDYQELDDLLGEYYEHLGLRKPDGA
jgi:tRNA-dihydrouridine synthase B